MSYLCVCECVCVKTALPALGLCNALLQWFTVLCIVCSICGLFCYGVAMIRRLLGIKGFFCKRALYKRRYSAKETYNFKEHTNRGHPIQVGLFRPNTWLFLSERHVACDIYICIYIYVYTHINIFVCMYVYWYTCIYIHIYIHTYIYIDIYTHIYIQIYIHMYIHINIYICISKVRTCGHWSGMLGCQIFISIYIYIHTYIFMCIYISIHSHIHIYIHTHTHTHTYIHVHVHM